MNLQIYMDKPLLISVYIKLLPRAAIKLRYIHTVIYSNRNRN